VSDGASEEMVRYLESLGADRSTLPDNPMELGGVAFDLAFGRDAEFTMYEIAEAAGLDIDAVERTYRTLGVTTSPDARQFTSGDVDLVRLLVSSIEGPLEEDEGGQILRVAARALTSIAEAAVAEVRQGVESRHESIDDSIRESAQMGELAIDLSSGLGVAFRHHLRQAADRQRVGQQGVRDRELIRVAIGFIDLVGFTGLTARLPVDRLVALVNSLERRSAELASNYDVRIVKIIGDEVMFVGLDAKATCAFALDLVATFVDDVVIPRGGLVYGEVLFRHGDYYGPMVNRASRIADLAVPGEILVDGTLAQISGVGAEPAGRRVLRGFDEPVEVFALG
jgi:adenylate cyclase